jgi:hypothetical protein
MLSRRMFLASAAAAPLSARRPSGLKIGVMDGVLRMSGKHLRVQQGDRRWESGRPDSKLLQCHTPTA